MGRQVDHIQPTCEEVHYIWSLYQNDMEVNSVTKPLVTVTTENSHHVIPTIEDVIFELNG